MYVLWIAGPLAASFAVIRYAELPDRRRKRALEATTRAEALKDAFDNKADAASSLAYATDVIVEYQEDQRRSTLLTIGLTVICTGLLVVGLVQKEPSMAAMYGFLTLATLLLGWRRLSELRRIIAKAEKTREAALKLL